MADDFTMIWQREVADPVASVGERQHVRIIRVPDDGLVLVQVRGSEGWRDLSRGSALRDQALVLAVLDGWGEQR